MKKNSFIVFGILVITLSVLLVGCTGNTESKETTLPETEVSTTQALPEYATETSTTEELETEALETTKTQNSGNSGSSSGGNNYTPTQSPTKAPETTAKPAPKPTEEPKETKPAKDEVNDFDTGELPTYADGSINAGAMREEAEEEMGGIVYF